MFGKSGIFSFVYNNDHYRPSLGDAKCDLIAELLRYGTMAKYFIRAIPKSENGILYVIEIAKDFKVGRMLSFHDDNNRCVRQYDDNA